jgi:acyl carrier protein
MDKSAVFNKLQAIISEAIEIDTSEIGENSSLIDDLGIESVDMLYIIARVESEFNIEWSFLSVLTDPQIIQDGKITQDGVMMLRKQFSDADFEDVEAGTSVINFIGKFTVNSMVSSILASSPNLDGAEIPNHKHQISNKFQNTISKSQIESKNKRLEF